MRPKIKYFKKNIARAKRASNNEHIGRAMWANQSKPCGQEDKGQAGHYNNITSQTYRDMRAIYAEDINKNIEKPCRQI